MGVSESFSANGFREYLKKISILFAKIDVYVFHLHFQGV